MSVSMSARRGSQGFSTMEALVAAAISATVMTAAFSFFSAQHRAMAVEGVYAQSQVVTRTALDLLARELRMASYDPSNTALAVSPGPSCPGVRQGLVDATPTSIHFKQDLNGDGDTLDANEDLTYDVSSGSITRRDGTSTAIALVTGIPANGFAIRYFDGSNPPVELVPVSPGAGQPVALTASQRDCVTKVRLALIAQFSSPDTARSAAIRSISETQVAIRNRSLSTF